MTNRYVFRLYIFALVLLGGFSALVWRLWAVQIEGFKKYSSQLPTVATQTQRLRGIRGEIKDRNGVPLAINRMSYEIKLDLKEIERLYKARHTEVPVHRYRNPDKFGTIREQEEPDIVRMFEEDVKPQLEKLNLSVADSDFEPDLMRKLYRSYKGIIPYTYREQIPFDDLAIAAEQSRFLEGVTISRRPLRKYPFGSMMCHILGYVKQPGPLEVPLSDAGKYSFYEPDDFGIEGIEKTMDNVLKGRAGRRVFPRDEHGKIVPQELMDRHVDPVKGSDIHLTIDIRIQAIAEQALRDAKIGRGAAVVIDPNNGDVLAMVSVPNFDPNKFIPSIDPDDWEVYIKDETNPLTNRALLGYPPGSTFKIPVAMAGCVAGISGRYYTCNGVYTVGNRGFKCWAADKGFSHGSLGLADGIMHSCNCFFYQYGISTGIENIDKVCHWFGLGEMTGIDIPHETPGVVPNPKMLSLATGERWRDSDTANTSIGQGQVLATPLQMCNVAATVANFGVCYKPRLILKVHDNGENMDVSFPEHARVDLQKMGVKKQSVELVRKGMWKVVNGEKGTAKKAQVVGKDLVAGKTGTAQAWRIDETDGRVGDNKTWFMCFAPYEAPKFAVCVFVEHGYSGGGTSAPIAARILKQAMAVAEGKYHPPVQTLAEARGHFNEMREVAYADDPVDAAIAAANAEDEAVTEAEPTTPSPRSAKKQEIARPTIKKRRSSSGHAHGESVRSLETPASEPSSQPKKGLLDWLFKKRAD